MVLLSQTKTEKILPLNSLGGRGGGTINNLGVWGWGVGVVLRGGGGGILRLSSLGGRDGGTTTWVCGVGVEVGVGESFTPKQPWGWR